MTWPEILTYARARVGFCESCELPNGDVDRWERDVTCAHCGEPEVFGTYAAFGARAIVEIRNNYHGAEW